MAKINMKTNINVAADEVWKLIGGFNTLPDWHPAIEKSELEEEGSMRRLSLTGGGTIVEKLERLDDSERVYTYSIIDSPLPVSNYTATIRVKEDGEGKTTVEWSSEFEAKGAAENEAMDVIAGIYQVGFDNLKKIFGG
ncbi:MAG: SRPBCC family protein [Proteobacteria bacterium]|nr:SRPBCC family protein [Pseudomonadota bacterium]MCH8262252.1 SRPBCC family protein [Pseudomonadota bacterium]MCH9047703.1 SRPBCC family protein [Pseudomonadota bacterium]